MFSDFESLLTTGDICSLTFVAMVLIYIGQLCIGKHPRRSWGPKLAVTCFLLWIGKNIALSGIPNGDLLFGLVLQGLVAAGLVLGVSWILLGLVFSIVDPLSSSARRTSGSVRYGWKRRREARREEKRRKKEEREQKRTAPERERKRLEEEEQKKRDEDKKNDDHHRREEARLACEMFYDRNFEVLQLKFPKPRLDEYFRTYLGDNHNPDLVEKRAEQLKLMLLEMVQGENGDKQATFSTLADIRAFYGRERENIEQTGYDDETRQTLFSDLAREEDRVVREFRKA